MPDFSLDASREFWKSFDDPKVFEVISFMEKIESWTLDGNEKIESAFKNNLNYICNETLSNELVFSSSSNNDYEKISLVGNIICNVLIDKQ